MGGTTPPVSVIYYAVRCVIPREYETLFEARRLLVISYILATTYTPYRGWAILKGGNLYKAARNALIALALAEAHHRLTIILQISNESLAARVFRVAQLSKQATPGQALQVRLWVFLVGFEAEGTTERQFGFALVERC